MRDTALSCEIQRSIVQRDDNGCVHIDDQGSIFWGGGLFFQMRARLAALQKAPQGEVQPSVPLSAVHAPPEKMEQQHLQAANASSSFSNNQVDP